MTENFSSFKCEMKKSRQVEKDWMKHKRYCLHNGGILRRNGIYVKKTIINDNCQGLSVLEHQKMR